MVRHLKKLSEEVIHENPWWQYKHDRYQKPSGEEGDYYYLDLPGCSLIVPVLADGRLALILQHRYLYEKQSIEFPAGGIGDGLDAFETAKKELLEEAGCIAEDFVQIGTFEPDTGVVRDMTHVFLAHVVEQRQPQPEETEEIEVMYRRPDEIAQMILRNEIWNGQTLAAWAMVQSYLRNLHTSSIQTEAPGLQRLLSLFDM